MKRSYTKEFKEAACKLVIEDGIKVSVVAERLGINPVMLHRWVSEYETYALRLLWAKAISEQQMPSCAS